MTLVMSLWSLKMAESLPTDCCFFSGDYGNPTKEIQNYKDKTISMYKVGVGGGGAKNPPSPP